MGRVTERRRVVRIRGGKVSTRPDTLVAEEPLEIRLNGKPLAITMRTPGDDFALAAGFLVSEGVLARDSDLATIAYCAGAVAASQDEPSDELVDGPPGGLGGAAGGGGGVAAGWTTAPLPAAVERRAVGVGRGGAALPVIDTRGGAGSAPGGAGARGANTYNVVDVHLAPGVPLPDIGLERNVYTTSSCGLCGKASLEAVRTTARWPVGDPATPVVLSPDVLAALPDRLRAAQRVFERTGGLHAAALFTTEGELLDVREDVGRHNAVDKLVGRALQQGRLPLSSSVLLVSGRASFELAQKAVMAGIPVLAAVSAPSSLAVDLAEETGLTLIGFLRGADMNVYAGAERVSWDE
ncbi:formate dehydrogenase accessory sulfurtransferase FdhD [Streptomyces buecherae]|uniref:Sulfur carrier protein FdhD n=1 Tax=Streptomyces buecherae TaxID=2763006 RepID=A0A7H8N3T4_9ACTN|nr:formate dehydrogenase accessory sulfurtransferase FdhD [Streptomyces buecherae]QKW49049.1 formate dehydrogenase accessory sulfurtransferase FdhD [Streptomyces buecherae]